MLHACVERFDVIGGRENILGWDEEVNKALKKIFILTTKHPYGRWLAPATSSKLKVLLVCGGKKKRLRTYCVLLGASLGKGRG
jgi:hypothetical protein